MKRTLSENEVANLIIQEHYLGVGVFFRKLKKFNGRDEVFVEGTFDKKGELTSYNIIRYKRK